MAEEVLDVSGMIAACRPWWLRVLAEAYLAAGRHADALDTARNAVEMARMRREREFEAHGLRTFGLACAAGADDQRREAEGYVCEAIEQTRSLGMQPIAAHCQKTLGDLYRAAGRVEDACQAYHAAATVYRELGMEFWLESLERSPLDAPRS